MIIKINIIFFYQYYTWYKINVTLPDDQCINKYYQFIRPSQFPLKHSVQWSHLFNPIHLFQNPSDSLCTVRLISRLVVPATLAAVQVYLPVSPGWAKAICSAPVLRTRWRTDSLSSCPSLYQVIEGVGKPSEWHCRVTDASSATLYALMSDVMIGGTVREVKWITFGITVFHRHLNFHHSLCVSLTLHSEFGLP